MYAGKCRAISSKFSLLDSSRLDGLVVAAFNVVVYIELCSIGSDSVVVRNRSRPH